MDFCAPSAAHASKATRPSDRRNMRFFGIEQAFKAAAYELSWQANGSSHLGDLSQELRNFDM